MKITLIYPRFEYKNIGNVEEPLGILYIASVLKKSGHQVYFHDLTFAKDLEVLREDICNSDLAGFSCTSPLFGIAKRVLKYIKELKPDIKTVAGGPHPTQDPESALRAGFDFVVIGEGEVTILELIRGIERECFDNVRGIAYKKGSDFKINPPQPFIDSLDSLPLPDRSLIDYSKYFTFGIMATRGCPFNCFYCKPMQDRLFGNCLRKRGVSSVVDEIEQLIKIDKHKVIYFKDDTLTAYPPDWFKDFGNELKRRGLKAKWGCNSRVDTITGDKLELMKKAGCLGLSFGVESGSQRIIDFYNKKTRVEQVIDTFSLCRKLKINTLAFIMLGAPIETREDLEMTYRLILKIKPDHWIVYVTTPFPGNYLYEYAAGRGIIRINDYLEYDNAQNSKDLKLPMQLECLTKEDIEEYRNKINHYMIKRTVLRRAWGILTQPREFKKIIFETPKVFNLLRMLLSRY